MNSTTRPFVGVSAIIRRDQHILLGWRIAGHGANSWQFPGGHLEYGEEIIPCALREIEEETGLHVANPQLGPYTNDIFAEADRHYITLYVLAEYAGGEPQVCEPHKCARWAWFRWDALPTPLFLPIANLQQQGLATLLNSAAHANIPAHTHE